MSSRHAAGSSFAAFARGLDYPLYVATTAVEGERSGCLIGFATQCSIHPPRFLACLSRKNHTLALASGATVLAIHAIEQQHRALAELFGGETGDQVDKFRRVEWHEEHGVPVLSGCRRWFVGRILQQIDLGDHVGFLLDPLEARSSEAAPQLGFQQARDIEPGHEP